MNKNKTNIIPNKTAYSEEKYRTLFDNMQQGFCIIEMIFDEDGKAVDYRFLEVNPVFERQTGFKKAAGKTIKQLIPSIEEHWLEMYGKVAKTGKPAHYENHVANLPAGSWYEVFAFPFGASADHQVAVLFNDITKRKNAEKALRISEEKYRTLFDLLDQGFVVIELIRNNQGQTIDFLYLEANAASEKHVGKKPEELIGKTALEMYPDLDKSWINTFAGIVNNNKPLRFEDYVKEDDIWYEVSAYPTHNDQIAVIYYNITERKRNEQKLQNFNQQLEQEVADRTAELKENQDFLRAVIDNSPDMIQIFTAIRNSEGKIIDFKWILNNRVSEELYGNVGNRTLLENNPGVVQEGIFDAFVQVTETGIPQQYEKHYIHEQFDGWFFQSVIKLNDGVATSTADITVRKMAELEIESLNRELLRKNRDLEGLTSELQTFTNIAANDYQATLHKLYTGFEQVLKNDAGKMSDSGKAAMRRAQSGLQKLKMLTEDIINFLKLSVIDQEMSMVDMADLAERVIFDLREKIIEKKAEIEIDMAMPKLQGYPVLLTLLVRHILGNALKFSKPDATPRIEIKYKYVKDKVSGSGLAYPICHEISFRDYGIGFEQKYSSEIFKIFYKHHENYKGAGVGLAVCQKIMALHEGFIEVESTPGKGSVFYCYFPCEEDV